MAISEFESKRAEAELEKFIAARRPPVHLRSQVDLGYRISGQSVEIFEIRPRWDRPEIKIEIPVAKATYVKARNLWKVFWRRQDLKWHGYQPVPEVRRLEDFLRLVGEDRHACFFG